VLSEDTGYSRDYSRNPYSGYDNDDDFIFQPSNLNTTYDPKTIMAVFRDKGTTFTAPWLDLREAGGATVTENETTYTLTLSDTGELTITDDSDGTHPFYFEMWFSVAVQHTDELIVITP
jgi:hypothetical protein